MNLLIINNKGSNSTVLNALLKYLPNEFESIAVLFCKKFSASDLDMGKQVTLFKTTFWDILRAMFYTILQLCTDSFVRHDFQLAREKKLFNINYFFSSLKYLIKGNALFYAAKRYLRNKNGDTVVFSTWYSFNAYAVARLKQYSPQYAAISYAHSYEVDWRKNPYVGLQLDLYKNSFLDKVYFISENVMLEYLINNKDVLKYPNKNEALHFGSEKKCDGLCKPSDDSVFRILTCSGVSKVKRLDLMVNALSKYSGPPIKWTHLGSGQLFEQIKLEVQKSHNPNVTMEFPGYVTNDKVHLYYTTHCVDLFVNISSSEGLPVSIMEAMSYGVPVLATDVGGNSEIVTENTGWLFPADVDAKLIKEKIEHIVLDTTINNKRKEAFNMWECNYRIDKNVQALVSKTKEGFS